MLLQDLKRRVEALESARRRQRNGIARYNAHRAAAATELHRAIQAIWTASPQPHRLTAKHVIRELDLNALGCPNLSLRAVRHHLRAIRGSG